MSAMLDFIMPKCITLLLVCTSTVMYNLDFTFLQMILLKSIYFQNPVMLGITWQIMDVVNVTQELGVKQVLQAVLIVQREKHLQLDLPLRVIARGVSENFG